MKFKRKVFVSLICVAIILIGTFKYKQIIFLINKHIYKSKGKAILRRIEFFEGIENGNLPQVKKISQYLDINIRDYNGDSALHLAIKSGHPSICDFLIQKGIDVNKTDHNGNTPLFLATRKGYLKICKLLVNNGARINIDNKSGINATTCAQLNNKWKVVKYLKSKGGKIKYTKNYFRMLMIKGAVLGSIKKIKIALKHGISSNIVDNGHRTPLCIAVEKGHYKTCHFLLTHGAKVNIGGKTPLYIASSHNNYNLCKLLITFGANLHPNFDGPTPLIEAVENNNYKMVKLFIKKKANVDQYDTQTLETPLHIVAGTGNVQICKLILQKTKDLNPILQDGTTPLHIAVNAKHYKICELLLRRGANVNLIGPDGETPIFGAVMNKDLKTCKLLLNYGAKVNIRSGTLYEKWDSLLETAALSGNYAICKLLIQKGAGITNTVLFYAIEKNSYKLTKLIINQGIKVNIKDHKKQTPLFIAAKKGYLTLVKFLVSKGAKVRLKDKFGFTPCDLAKIHNHPKTLKFLLSKRGYLTTKGLLFTGAANGNINTIKKALKKGANYYDTNENGVNPFFIAIAKGYTKICKFFIKMGVNINSLIQGSTTWRNEPFFLLKATPLYFAVIFNKYDICNLLIKNGADVNKPGPDSSLPLFAAIEKKNPKLCEFLIQNGANIESKEMFLVKKIYPVQKCVYHNCFECLKILVKHGANIYKNHQSLLKLAFYFRKTKIIKYLILNGAITENPDRFFAPGMGKAPKLLSRYRYFRKQII